MELSRRILASEALKEVVIQSLKTFILFLVTVNSLLTGSYSTARSNLSLDSRPSDHIPSSLVLPRLELEIRCNDRFEVGCENDQIAPGPDDAHDLNGGNDEPLKTHSAKNPMPNLN